MRLLRVVVGFAVWAVVAVAGAQQYSLKDQPAAAFERLKALGGEWEATVVEGGQKMSAPLAFRVASGGSVLMSDLAPGTPHEMVTMIHRDLDNLLATHYCLAGNRPRMRLLPGIEPNVIAFDFKDATNLPNPAAPHMAGVKFTLLDPSHHIEEWTVLVNGQSSLRKFECRRKS